MPLEDCKLILFLFAVKEILNPVCKLALKLQHENGALCDIPDLIVKVKNQFNEIITLLVGEKLCRVM